MSPLALEFLLNYRWNPHDFRDGDFTDPAVRSLVNDFQQNGMIELDDERATRTYRLTSKGEYFINYLCSIPLPVTLFGMPPFEVEP